MTNLKIPVATTIPLLPFGGKEFMRLSFKKKERKQI